MSCCHQDPCVCGNCDPINEALSSTLNNFITQFFGSLTKTCVNNKVTWTLPCDLETGSPNFPRNSGEGLACYFLRYFNQIVITPPEPKVYGSFYALMLPDNPNPILPGSPILFPNDGPALSLVRQSDGAFILPSIATYEVHFQVGSGSINQIALRLNGVQLDNTILSQNTSGIIMTGNYFITTTSIDSTLEVINSEDSLDPLILLSANGSNPAILPASAWLTIKKL